MPEALDVVHRHVAPRDAAREVWRLLVDVDEEFVPPLSARLATTQTHLTTKSPRVSDADGRGPLAYHTAVLEQELILAEVADEVVGLASYIPHHQLDLPDGRSVGPVTYLSTIAVAAPWRGRRIARGLYAELFDVARRNGEPVVTRTWSTNDSHLRVLQSLGFDVIARVVDGRGAGIDTVYFRREA